MLWRILILAAVVLLTALTTVAQLSESLEDQPPPALDDQPLAADPGLYALIADLAADGTEIAALLPDFAAVSANPARFHGQTFHLTTGPATRVATSAFDIPNLSAWQFASDGVAEPILLLIHEPEGSIAPADQVTSIELDATYWKSALATMSAPSGDLTRRETESGSARPMERILVFVGTKPVYMTEAANTPLSPWTSLVVALLVGGAVLLVVRRMARQHPAPHPCIGRDPPQEQWDDADLPEEPAEALAELRRRGEDTMSHDA
jgi:hypothetical protein